MITIRSLAGTMATEMFGRDVAIGHELVREFQRYGLFPRGTRGGNPDDQPMAGSAHVVALWLALAMDRGPKKAVESAIAMWLLPGAPHYSPVHRDFMPEKAGSEEIARARMNFLGFGHHLACLTAAQRSGVFRGELPVADIAIGLSTPAAGDRFIFASIQSTRVMSSRGGLVRSWLYGMPAKYVPGLNIETPHISGFSKHIAPSLICDLAKLLGPQERDGDAVLDQMTLDVPAAGGDEAAPSQFWPWVPDARPFTEMLDAPLQPMPEHRVAETSALPAGFVLDVAGAVERNSFDQFDTAGAEAAR